jgi:hypothetical protein
MPEPMDEFAAFTGAKKQPKDDFASFTGKAKPAAQAQEPVTDDFAAFQKQVKAEQEAPPPNSEFAPIIPGEVSSPGTGPSLPSVSGLLTSLKQIPGRVKKFVTEKEAEHNAAVAAQQQKMGTVGQQIYSAPNPLLTGLSPEAAVEAGKSVAGKIQKLWTGLKPNRAKENAEWAEKDMRDLLKEVDKNPPTPDGRTSVPTPQQLQRFRDRRAYANQMWAFSETERGARQQAIQSFNERMDKLIAPGTPGAKFVGSAVPIAVQAATVPESIPFEMAANAVAESQLRNPTYEQTLGQQIKEGIAGYGMGKLMMAGVPGTPVSRALQGAGVSPIPANVLGMGVTSAANTLGSHQLARYLTTPHGETPAAPSVSDYLSDFAMQAGLGARHLNQRLALAPAGAPPTGMPSEPVPVGVRPLETPTTPGEVNPTPTETAPLPGSSTVEGPAMLPGLQPGKLQTIFPGVPPKATAADVMPGTSFSWQGEYGQSGASKGPGPDVDITSATSYQGKRQGPLLGPNDEHLVARDPETGKDIGRLWLTKTPTGFEVRKVETDPSARGKGVARKLYLEARSQFGPFEGATDFTPEGRALTDRLRQTNPEIFIPDEPAPAPTRVQPPPEEGLPDAYGLAPVTVEPGKPTPHKTLHEHEAEMAVTRQQRQADRIALMSGPEAATRNIAPEHHAEADRILEARNIVTVTERRALEAEREILKIQVENRQRQAEGKVSKPVPEELTLQAKSRNAPGMDELKALAASEPQHPDAQRAMRVAQEQQQALAAEYAASTPGGEGDITHLSRIAQKEAPVEPSLGARVREFFGGPSTVPVEAGLPGTGKRPKQKNEYSKARLYETVDGPAGPVVIYKEANPDGSHDIVGRKGTIQEGDITGRREATKDEITKATSQVEVQNEDGTTSIVEDPSAAINFSRNAVASAVKARESARDAIRGRRVVENLKANPAMFREGEAPAGSEWRNVKDLPITDQVKLRLAPGGKAAHVRSDVAQTLIEYFGKASAKEASFLSGLNKATRNWTERGLLTNVFAHFPNQFNHGLGALAGEGMKPQEAINALTHAYKEGQNPNSEYVNRAKAAGVRQMSQGRIFGENDNITAHEAATQRLEAALGHAPGSLGKLEGNSLKRAFQALNQKTVWQVDDAIRNTLFYQKIASGMTPEQAARYANENYVGYHTDTNLFELNPNRSPRSAIEMGKKGLNEIYRNLVTGKGETGEGFPGTGATLARTLISPLFHTFRTNSAQLLAHELKNAAVGLPQGDLKGLGKLANVAGTGTAVAGILGQTLSDALLTEQEKKQGKEYQMRAGGPFHWYETAEKALEGRATPMQTAAAIATPNPLFKHLIGKGIFGVDVQSGRPTPAKSLAELGDTVLSSVLPTGDIGRNALQGAGNPKDVVASFFMGKNAPNPAAQIMMAHPDKQAASAPDYEQSRANYRLISGLRNLEPGSKEYVDEIKRAVDEQILTRQQIANAAKRSNQSELEHMRALAKISTPDAVVAAAETYRESSPDIARALYSEAQSKLYKQAQKFTGQRNLKLLGQVQKIANLKETLR